jgi:hypothetical protein
MSNWLYKQIMGDDPAPERPEIKIPIIDDPPSPTPWKPSPSAEALFRRLEVEAAFAQPIFDDNDLAKAVATGSFDNRSYENSTQPKQPVTFTLPTPTPDPRKKQCFCDCPQCVRQSCENCLASPRCEYAGIALLDALIPADPQEQLEEMEQAAKAQQKRYANTRLAKHREGLEPAFRKFRDAIPYGYSPAVSGPLNRVYDAMVANVAEAQAAGWR